MCGLDLLKKGQIKPESLKGVFILSAEILLQYSQYLWPVMLYKGFPKIQTVSPISMAWDHKNLRSGLILFRMRVASSLPVDLCIFNHIFRDCTYPFFDKLMPYFGRPTANHISFKRQPITVPPQMPSFRHSGAMSILLSLILI